MKKQPITKARLRKLRERQLAVRNKHKQVGAALLPVDLWEILDSPSENEMLLLYQVYGLSVMADNFEWTMNELSHEIFNLKQELMRVSSDVKALVSVISGNVVPTNEFDERRRTCMGINGTIQ